MSGFVDKGPWTVPATAVHEVEHAGRSWTVTVAQPLQSQGPVPVVYVLDPFGTLLASVGAARTTNVLSQGLLPGLLVVGVGPTSEDFGELSVRRLLDLTPTDPDAATLAQTAGSGITYGGLDAFLDLLVDVVAPEVETRYGGDPDDRTLAGWSLGGLAAVHALLSRPQAFRHYLAVSPSLWWNDSAILSAVPSLPETGPRAVYLGVGDLEDAGWGRMWPPLPDGVDLGTLSDARMVRNLRRLAADLRALHRPGLTVHAEVLRGEHHNTLWPAAFTRGLLALHAGGYEVDG